MTGKQWSAATLVLLGPAALLSLAVWEFALSLILYLIGIAVMLGGAGAVIAVLVAPVRRGAREADRSLERERFASMTWLTQADEVWLADRHFWAVPREVARLRGGQQWDKPWTYELGGVPREVQARERMAERANRARDAFEGVNLSPEVERSEPVSGEVLDPLQRPGAYRLSVYRNS